MPSNSATFFLIAGEPSGDSRGAELVHALKNENPNFQFIGLGGPKMEAEGVKLLFDMTSISALGFGDVLRQYFKIRGIFYNALKHVRQIKPDAIILIDYPGFNLRFAKKINRRIPIFYYVSPQIWAWGMRRIHTIRRVVSHMLVFFQFEEALYKKAGVPVTWVGHPLLDSVKPSKSKPELKKEFGIEENKTVISLLPGSRETEVKRILPVMLESADLIKKEIPNVIFLVSESGNVSEKVYHFPLNSYSGKITVKKIGNRMYDLLAISDFALVTSGTATLETTILQIPYVLLYKTARSTYAIGKQLVRVSFLGIANIIAGRKMIPEFIQHEANPQKIAAEVISILKDSGRKLKMLADLKEVKQKLGPASASARAAKRITALLN